MRDPTSQHRMFFSPSITPPTNHRRGVSICQEVGAKQTLGKLAVNLVPIYTRRQEPILWTIARSRLKFSFRLSKHSSEGRA
jgi:hypothetical protein